MECMKFDDLHHNNDASKYCKHQASILSKHVSPQASNSSSKQIFQAVSNHLKQ